MNESFNRCNPQNTSYPYINARIVEIGSIIAKRANIFSCCFWPISLLTLVSLLSDSDVSFSVLTPLKEKAVLIAKFKDKLNSQFCTHIYMVSWVRDIKGVLNHVSVSSPPPHPNLISRGDSIKYVLASLGLQHVTPK